MTDLKGYKVTDCNRKVKIGIACRSFKEFVLKACKKLSLNSEEVTVHLQDGTQVDSQAYFATLAPQTCFVFRRKGEELASGADLIYDALRLVNIDVLRTGDMVRDFFDERIKEKLRVLCMTVDLQQLDEKNDKDKAKLSLREDDPDWFKGLETNAKTKESFMFKRSQDRIRGYLYKTQSDIRKNPKIIEQESIVKPILDEVFSNFKKTLQRDEYFGCYLDRSQPKAFCNQDGEFKCAGAWNIGKCLHIGSRPHLINPYASRESRIVFSTWNFDHCVERSRTVIPALIEAATDAAKYFEKYRVNILYFYSLLFTSENLRLVHVVCHDKSCHDTAKCNSVHYLVTANTSIKNNNIV